jgi:hypothetical protein
MYRNWIGINVGDKDLTPVYLRLPQPPPEETIAGYGLPREEQYFRREDIPLKLRNVERRAVDNLTSRMGENDHERVTNYKLYMEFWRIIESDPLYYQDELKFMRRVWWYRTYGYFFFNDGEITYIPPDYYDYLNFWTMEDVPENGGHPEYRDRDRRAYLYRHYLEHTTETFTNVDHETGLAIKEFGKYEMKDTGSRVFFGDLQPKSRRGGATQQGCHKVEKGVSTMLGGYGTIISMDADNAEKHYYKKLLPAWRNRPLWLKPVTSSNNSPKTIKFEVPANIFSFKGLNGSIDYTESAGERKNDGDKLYYDLCDEEGKAKNVNVFERWNVNKLAHSLGGGTKIIGYSSHPSTVEEMDDGGMAYYALARQSNFYRRIPEKGQTYSGLGRMFFAAWDGMEGFIDRFGKSVIDKPTDRQIALSPHAKFARMRKGAKAVIMAERDTLLKDGSPQAMEQYRSIRRKQPIEYAECWMGTAGNLGFDIEKINQREAELRRMQVLKKLATLKVNFEWEGEPFNSKVRMVTEPDNGKFEVTTPIAEELRSLVTETMEWDAYKSEIVAWKAPVHGSMFTCGADPIGFDNKTNSKLRDGGSRQSNGGIAVLWEYDPSIEESADMHDWESRSFVATYSYRPDSTLEYLEDVLKCCIYFGAMLYAERNKDNLWQYFIEKGYGGYLKYDIDPRTGKRADKPGFYTGVENKNDLFGVLKDFISYRIHKEMFLSFLNELKEIKGPEQMTLYDRLTAHGAALMGSKSSWGKVIEREQKGVVWDADGYMPMRQY